MFCAEVPCSRPQEPARSPLRFKEVHLEVGVCLIRLPRVLGARGWPGSQEAQGCWEAHLGVCRRLPVPAGQLPWVPPRPWCSGCAQKGGPAEWGRAGAGQGGRREQPFGRSPNLRPAPRRAPGPLGTCTMPTCLPGSLQPPSSPWRILSGKYRGLLPKGDGINTSEGLWS